MHGQSKLKKLTKSLRTLSRRRSKSIRSDADDASTRASSFDTRDDFSTPTTPKDSIDISLGPEFSKEEIVHNFFRRKSKARRKTNPDSEKDFSIRDSPSTETLKQGISIRDEPSRETLRQEHQPQPKPQPQLQPQVKSPEPKVQRPVEPPKEVRRPFRQLKKPIFDDTKPLVVEKTRLKDDIVLTHSPVTMEEVSDVDSPPTRLIRTLSYARSRKVSEPPAVKLVAKDSYAPEVYPAPHVEPAPLTAEAPIILPAPIMRPPPRVRPAPWTCLPPMRAPAPTMFLVSAFA